MMNRRSFNKSMMAASLATALPVDRILSQFNGLKKGDTIGLIAPSSLITKDKLEKAILNLEGLGFKCFYDESILAKDGYLAGNDEHRLKALHDMYRNKIIDGIWCVRGGYGATRFLDQLDFELIRSNPKPLLGYSDITALLNTIHQETGSPCFHAPVASSTFSEYTKAKLKPIFGPNKKFRIEHSKENLKKANEDEAYSYYEINAGNAEGPLVGGNLSLLVSLVGTKHAVQTKGKIVFIEDIGEHCYRVDRMLTQLISSGFFDQVAGVAFGIFVDCTPEREETQTLQEVIMDRMKYVKVPAAYGFSFGHIRNQCTLPIGGNCHLNTKDGILTLNP